MAAVIITPAIVSAAKACSSAVALGSGFIDGKRTSTYVFAIEVGDRCVGFACVGHLDEPKSTGSPCIAVRNQSYGLDQTVGAEPLPQISFSGCKGEISYEQFLHCVPRPSFIAVLATLCGGFGSEELISRLNIHGFV
jgi:hypothetical protein